MNRSLLTYTLLTALLTIAPVAFSQQPAASPKIALVDISAVMDGYYKTKDAQKNLDAAVKGYEKDRKDMEAELRKVQEDGKKIETDLGNPALDEKTKEEKKKAIQDKLVEFNLKNQQLRELVMTRERQLAEQRGRLMESLYQEIVESAGKKAKELGYNLVLDKRKGGGVIFDGTGADITDQILKTMNAKAPAGGAAPAAAAPEVKK